MKDYCITNYHEHIFVKLDGEFEIQEIKKLIDQYKSNKDNHNFNCYSQVDEHTSTDQKVLTCNAHCYYYYDSNIIKLMSGAIATISEYKWDQKGLPFIKRLTICYYTK